MATKGGRGQDPREEQKQKEKKGGRKTMGKENQEEKEKCRQTAKEEAQVFKTDAEALDRGIKIYNDCLRTN